MENLTRRNYERSNYYLLQLVATLVSVTSQVGTISRPISLENHTAAGSASCAKVTTLKTRYCSATLKLKISRLDNVSDKGGHGDAAVLDFSFSEVADGFFFAQTEETRGGEV